MKKTKFVTNLSLLLTIFFQKRKNFLLFFFLSLPLGFLDVGVKDKGGGGICVEMNTVKTTTRESHDSVVVFVFVF